MFLYPRSDQLEEGNEWDTTDGEEQTEKNYPTSGSYQKVLVA